MGLFSSKPAPVDYSKYVGHYLPLVLKSLAIMKTKIHIIALKDDEQYHHSSTKNGAITIVYNSLTNIVTHIH